MGSDVVREDLGVTAHAGRHLVAERSVGDHEDVDEAAEILVAWLAWRVRVVHRSSSCVPENTITHRQGPLPLKAERSFHPLSATDAMRLAANDALADLVVLNAGAKGALLPSVVGAYHAWTCWSPTPTVEPR